MRNFLVLLFMIFAVAAVAQPRQGWLRPGELPKADTLPEVVTWQWTTTDEAPRPEAPVLVSYHIKEAFGARNTFASIILYTDAFTTKDAPKDELLSDLIVELTRLDRLEKVKGLSNPDRASINIMSFENVDPGFIFSTEQIPVE